MKTITIELTDNEAEALERLAFIHETDKSEYLRWLIKDGYDSIVYGNDSVWDYDYMNSFADDCYSDRISDQDGINTLCDAVSYDINNASDSKERKAIREKWLPIVDELINEIKRLERAGDNKGVLS